MKAVSALYCNGQTAAAFRVAVSVDTESCVIAGNGFMLTHPTSAVRLSPKVGSATRFLLFPDGSRCETRDHPALEAALQAGGFQVSKGRLRWLEQWPRAVAVAVLALTLSAIYSYRKTLPLAAAAIAERVPSSVDESLGQRVLGLLDAKDLLPSRLHESRQARIRTRFEDFLRASGYTGVARLEFRRSQRGVPNAFALPGGTVVVFDELVHIAQHEDELVAVFAHELGHLHHRHALRRALQNSVSFVLVTSLTGDVSVVSNIAAALPVSLLKAEHSREAESEADRFALAALRRAGIPPSNFTAIMERLDARRGRKSRRTTPYFDSHPPTAERVRDFGTPTLKSHEEPQSSKSAIPED